MGLLQQSFEKPSIQKESSILGQLFSSPLIRGFYKDEKPVIDFKIEGKNFEKRRMVSLINTIANSSPTGRKILEDAAKNGYSLGFKTQSDSFGFCDEAKKIIRLNPRSNDAKLITTLAHEARHTQQHMTGISNDRCHYDVATELKLRRATEADAQAAAAQTALEIRAATKNDSVWNSFKKTYSKLSSGIKEPPLSKSLDDVVKDSDKHMQDAFKGWFNQAGLISSYEIGYMYAYIYAIEYNSKLKAFKDLPFEGSLSSADILKTICVNAKGQSYFADDLNIMEREPEMCGISTETRSAVKRFFEDREKLTGKPQDKSYENLPDRGSLFKHRVRSQTRHAEQKPLSAQMVAALKNKTR